MTLEIVGVAYDAIVGLFGGSAYAAQSNTLPSSPYFYVSISENIHASKYVRELPLSI